MSLTPRYRRGDPSPVDAGLFFFRYDRYREVWVTRERLEKERDNKRAIQARRRRNPEHKKKMRDYFRVYNRTPKQRAYHSRFYKQAHVRKRIAKRHQERLESDIQYCVSVRLRNRVKEALRRNGTRKALLTEELIGCTVREFRIYFEAKFTGEMTWNDFVEGRIVLDHILPVSLFDLSDPAQQKAAFNFRNLQPLWMLDNLRESDKLPDGSRGRDLSKANVIPFRKVA